MIRLQITPLLAVALIAGCSRSTSSPTSEPDSHRDAYLPATQQPTVQANIRVEPQPIKLAVPKGVGNRAVMSDRPHAVMLESPAAIGIALGGPAYLIVEALSDLTITPEFFIPPSEAVVALAYGAPSIPVVRRWGPFDLGIDSELPLILDVDPKADVNVPGPVDATAPIGIVGADSDPKLPEIPGSSGGFGGRTGAAKAKPLPFDERDVETERAVSLALAWIANQQKSDGSWEFDGAQKSEKVAATAMAVLAFLGAGENHKTGKKYKLTVERGLFFLIKEQKPSGQVGGGTMYTNALGALALCEAYGITNDSALKLRAQSAISFIVKAQGTDGGWRYTPNAGNGDTSVFGWQIQALKSAQLAGLVVPKTCFQNAEKFLESVATDGGSQFGYIGKSTPSPTCSAIGLLGKLFLGATPRNDAVAKGVNLIWEKAKPNKNAVNLYYLWYGTLLFQQMGGDDAKNWNEAQKKILLQMQITDKADAGSWAKDSAFIGQCCGKLGTTCMTVLCLKVPYRHLTIAAPVSK